MHGGSLAGDLLVLAGAAVYSLQIVLMERFAPRYDAIAFTLVEMLAAFAGLLVIALAAGQLRRAARLDGVGCAARDRRLRERARVPRADVGAAAHERDAHGARVLARAGVGRASSASRSRATGSARLGWLGCVVIMAGIVLAEPAAADVLARLVRRPGVA